MLDEDNEWQYFHELRNFIEEELPKVEMKILFFPLDEDDAEFNSLLKKAAHYRDLLKKINDELKNL